MKFITLLVTICWLSTSCQQPDRSQNSEQSPDETLVEGNPAAPGFDLENSDTEAVAIADEVMEALGGRENWDKTRIITWNFLGIRSLIWDKWSGDVRIEVPDKELIILVNINNSQGKVRKGGAEFAQLDSLTKYLDQGMSIWINDSYWLVMPFKLKDTGVTLKYLGEELTQAGQLSDVLELTFKNVGKTPDNRYEVCVDKQSKLVTQWEFFRRYDDDSSAFVHPWLDYARHGDILLSGNRGTRQLTDIHVYDSLPAYVFNSFDPVDFASL